MDWGCMSLDSRERRSAWRARICDRSWSAGSATYQLYHGITDTNLTLLPLPNEFFFGVFLKHRTTLSYRTLDPSGLLCYTTSIQFMRLCSPFTGLILISEMCLQG